MQQMIHELPHQIPPYPGGKNLTSYNCNDGCFLYHLTDTTEQDYVNYQAMLDAAGFTLIDRHSIRDNYFVTYTFEGMRLHVYFTANDGITRIILDPNTTPFQSTQALITPATHKTTLYQMELDFRTIDCGMCYITQCADGSFFIIDSAHMNSTNDHLRLYQLLRKLTPKGNRIVIAGWFFSHAHQDHIFKFMDFIEAGFTDCTIECLYYNFPSLTAPGYEHWKEDDIQTIREFFALVEKHTEIPRIKLHTGQHFFLRNLEFEVLGTHEDMYPQPLNRFNDTSTILLMTIDGCKTLFLGDANVEESTILVARYGSYLKSDIIQVAHHGYNGSNVGIYFCADAKVALYSVPKGRYETSLESEANMTVHRISEEIYVAGNGTVALELPYTAKSAVVFPKEIND